MTEAATASAAITQGAGRLRVARRLALDASLAEVTRALAAPGVQPLLIKGPATARWLYDDPSERSYGDLDLLVAPDRFETAGRVLAELGFRVLGADGRPGEFARHHEVWIRRGGRPAIVELHHSLCLLSAPPQLVWERLSAGSGPLEVAGVCVAVPAPAASALIVAVHAAQHGAGFQRPLRDLRHAVERVDEQTWRAAQALADELGGGAAFAAGLQLDPAGRELAERLGLPATAAPRVVRLLASSPAATAMGVERMMAAPGSRARIALLASELVPSPAFMRVWQPLARRGWCGLAIAYLWRPFWLGAKLPRGVRAWLHATRAAPDRQARR